MSSGRGATENRTSSRFNLPERETDGDWLDARETVDEGAPPLRTSVTVEHPRTILTRNASPDIGFDRSINPYRGCDQSRNGCDTNQENLTPQKHASFTGVLDVGDEAVEQRAVDTSFAHQARNDFRHYLIGDFILKRDEAASADGA